MANFGSERIYQNFEPATRWTSEPDAEILVSDLPGFKKEQLKVAVTATRKLRLTGERPTGGNKWIRFHKEIPVPLSVDIDSVSAIFKDNKLYIRHPKVKTETQNKVIMEPHETKQDHLSSKTDQLKHDKVIMEPHETKQDHLSSKTDQLKHDEPKGHLSSKDDEKDKVGAKWFEKYKEATGNVVKEAKNKRKLLCNLSALVFLVLLILMYARNAVRSSFVWKSEE